MLTLHITPDMRRKLEAALAEKGRCRLAAMPFSATAFLALELQTEFRHTVVLTADSMHSLDELRRNLTALAGAHPERILYYPAWESLPTKDGRQTTDDGRRTGEEGRPSKEGRRPGEEGRKKEAAISTEAVGERLQTLERLTALRTPVVIATCVQALMQMTLSPAALKAHTFRLTPGAEHDLQTLAERLEKTGYAFEPEVQAKGQAARRGGILDVWPLNEAYPFRIEFDGATVETIRSFDPATQRSFTSLPGSAPAVAGLRPDEKEAVLLPVNEWNLMRAPRAGTPLEGHAYKIPPGQGTRPTENCRPGAHTGRGLAVHDVAGAEARCLFMNYLPPELIYLWSEPVTMMTQPSGRQPKLYHPSRDVSSRPLGESGLDMTRRNGHSDPALPERNLRPIGIRRHAAIYQEALDEAKVTDLTIPFARLQQVIAENKRAWQCLPDPSSPERFPLREAASSFARRASMDKSEGQVGGQAPVFDTVAATEDHIGPSSNSDVGSVRQPPDTATVAVHSTPPTKTEIPAHPAPDADWPPPAERVDLGFRSMTALAAPRRDPDLLESGPDIFAERRRQWLANLAEQTRHGLRVHIFFYTQGALDRFHEMNPEPAFHLHVGMLSDGFMQAELQLAVLSESNLLGRPKLLPDRAARTPSTRRKTGIGTAAGETITDWTSLEPGDLVVHVDHGIGRYLGLNEIVFPSSARRSPDSPGGRDAGGNGKRQEALTIEYADKAKLYVPVAQAHLLSRYVGVGRHAPGLHRLGGARWTREKDAVERAVRDLAADLLAIQAARESMPGIAFQPDTPWQNEFEASFPYQETLDQEHAIGDVKRDMETSRPMDRLICGDVGYGKTEVAMRAAFKCVMSGKQAAVLAPTTVLAQQHYEVFAERMAAYPVRVELLCRFRTLSEQAAVVRGLSAGAVDIVIGTHRLIQPDVRFKDLGLVIIDEEQRFGVGHKERFKHLQQLVDVLTLTATPIPRTLYMSLTGAREISMIQTSPKARQAIETIVAPADDGVIRDAILRELNRGGQIYYLHNRVHSIERVRARLEKLAPEARIAVGHGQMPTAALAHIMQDFARGDYDLLLCTTIIESGLDIPNVNTILIDRADRFGMADLYQLRGRVGRSSRKAYAYMLLPERGYLMDAQRRRIQALLEHTELGAGFRLAMRDLEIRGAGNLLGSEQSGHIAAIGFDLYCQLLRWTIAQMSSSQKKPGLTPGQGTRPTENGQFCSAREADPPLAGRPVPTLQEVGTTGRVSQRDQISRIGSAAMPTRIVNVEVVLDFIELSAQAADLARAAFLPADYVEDERLRIGVYRQIASAMTLGEIDGLRSEFRDRFGPLPQPLERLLKIAALRILAAEKKITLIETREGKIVFQRQAELLQVGGRFPRLRAAGADAQLDELFQWLRRVEDRGFASPRG